LSLELPKRPLRSLLKDSPLGTSLPRCFLVPSECSRALA
jgi:hypothetical protein